MLITFSGLDGSGKTTLVGLLRASLERRDVRATVSHMYRDVGVYALGRALVRRLRGRARRPTPGGIGEAAADAPAPKLVWNK